MQCGDLFPGDGAASTTVDADVARPARIETFDQVTEELHVSALVGRNRYGSGVLLHGRVHDLFHRAVVPEMDHLGAAGLQQPAHDVDRSIVTIEERRRRDDAHRARLAMQRDGSFRRGAHASPPIRLRTRSR